MQGLTSRKRRDILRKTWVPSGRLDEVEARLGVRIRFFLGYSQQKGDSVEKELQAEMREVSRLLGEVFSHGRGACVGDKHSSLRIGR
jgi:hypothetical protein